jgi:hypothetical protein
MLDILQQAGRVLHLAGMRRQWCKMNSWRQAWLAKWRRNKKWDVARDGPEIIVDTDGYRRPKVGYGHQVPGVDILSLHWSGGAETPALPTFDFCSLTFDLFFKASPRRTQSSALRGPAVGKPSETAIAVPISDRRLWPAGGHRRCNALRRHLASATRPPADGFLRGCGDSSLQAPGFEEFSRRWKFYPDG